MEIRELADFIIRSLTHGGYAVWGTLSSGEQGWGLNPNQAVAYPMYYKEAEKIVETLKTKYGGDYEIVSREKSHVTLTKA